MLSNSSSCRVLVVGDVMLDRYWFGEVTRISPEAPVPIVRVRRSEERPGGAANVARNAASLGPDVTLLSVVGADEAGSKIQQLVTEAGVRARFHEDPTINTTVKHRVLGGQQQLLRMDFEDEPDHEVLSAKVGDFRNIVSGYDVVVLSDYGKGGLTHVSEMISLARACGKSVLVDPKGSDYSKYSGATVITPNRSELRAVVGSWRSEAELREKVERLKMTLGLEAVLLTRSEEGISLFWNGDVLHDPAQARDVFDVSGAGDTVISTLAVCLACGMNWKDGVRISNLAAGIVVGKIGTAVVSREELELSIRGAFVQ